MDYGAIGIGIGIASVIFAGLAWLVANRSLKYQMLTELMHQYAQPAMGEAVATLHDFFHHDCDKKLTGMKKKFKDDIKLLDKKKKKEKLTDKEEEIAKGITKIDNARRQVSHFYQRMAALHEGHVLPDKILYRIWNEETLEIIQEIIIPLEEVLIKSIQEKEKRHKKRLEDNEVLKMLIKLYGHSKGPGIRII
jgi:hypothetical protein